MCKKVLLNYYSYTEFVNDTERLSYLKDSAKCVDRTFKFDEGQRFQLSLVYELPQRYYLFYKLKYE